MYYCPLTVANAASRPCVFRRILFTPRCGGKQGTGKYFALPVSCSSLHNERSPKEEARARLVRSERCRFHANCMLRGKLSVTPAKVTTPSVMAQRDTSAFVPHLLCTDTNRILHHLVKGWFNFGQPEFLAKHYFIFRVRQKYLAPFSP